MKKCLLSLAVLVGTYAHASPWIEVSQSELKHSIDLLVAEA